VARLAVTIITDQNKRDMYVSEAFKGIKFSWII
jgi:hypothetical protein